MMTGGRYNSRNGCHEELQAGMSLMSFSLLEAGSSRTAMSTLVFNGNNHTLTLFDAKGAQVGQPWHANNVVDSHATLRFVPNQTYNIIDGAHPHRHGGSEDTLNGAYGRFGILRLQDFSVAGKLHSGVGVHSGRADKNGADHPTMGCIRTSDEAMKAIVGYIKSDPLRSITVQGNHDQHNHHSKHRGDHHKPAQNAKPAVRNTPMT
jgi:hypothetical protein